VTADPVDRFAEAARIIGESSELDFPLATLTTYRVGGRAAVFVRVDDESLVQRIALAARATALPILVIGRGSNMLVSDSGFPGIAVQLGAFAGGISIGDDGLVESGSAVLLPVLARRTVAAGLTGFEWAVGVPGTVGGAVRMNAGGHGSDMAASLVDARILDWNTGALRTHSTAELDLRFRGSGLDDHQLVLGVRLRLASGDRAECERELDEIVRWRRENQPGGQNAGSVFVNPVPGEVAAGHLIDHCGLRGFRIGSAEVSMKHANFIQADADGKAADVLALMSHVRRVVADKTGHVMRSEVRLIGFGESF
jgi:UDP-N-acetylmuramate dehydrogenase